MVIKAIKVISSTRTPLFVRAIVDSVTAQLLKTGVAVEKVLSAKLAKNKIALRRPTNDVLNFLGIL